VRSLLGGLDRGRDQLVMIQTRRFASSPVAVQLCEQIRTFTEVGVTATTVA
jgi:hypothetical protein